MAYDTDFRRLAVVLVTTSSRPLNQLAGELAVPPSTLRRWVRDAAASATVEPVTNSETAMRRNGGSPAIPDPSHSPAAYSPLQRLPLLARISPVRGAARTLPPGRIPSLWRRLRPSHLPSVLVVTGWVVSVLLSTATQLSGTGHDLAPAVHLLSLVTALGATVMVDWHGCSGCSIGASSANRCESLTLDGH
jgi:transposase-like protein